MSSPNEIARLAAAVNLLRPDWPTASLQTYLGKHASRPYRDLALAMTWIALDAATRTPARLDEHGPWWTLGNLEATAAPPGLCQVCRRIHYPERPDEHVRPTLDPLAVVEHAMAARNVLRRQKAAG